MVEKKILIADVIDFLGDSVINVYGNTENVYVDNVADVAHVNATTLDWVNASKSNKQEIAETSVAKVMIVSKGVEYSDVLQQSNKVLIVVEKPRYFMAKIITHFFATKYPFGIHPSAVVDPEAVIDPSAYVGPACVIGKAKIGAGSVLVAGVVIYDNVQIGENCLIQAGAIIGTDGLGCSREKDGTLIKFPHLGGVVIGNNVEIGANCQIAKGALSDTFIDDGCKINGLCFIAHNSHLEKNVWITGDTMLCGSTHVEQNTTIYSNVIIREQSHIGSGVTIGMGSVVTKDIPNGETWYGSPARKAEKK